ncbi:hypothetical protein AWB75_07118 [Caballeronia catudaia]|uniref:Uncharacterized protein n=1 Tax=Caballeronia catudaia TaxID=1777136 RepID=A0A158DS14_9BURK|nr:hypothetical protein AWB75_07118 [Caballeronia catudaia]
MKPLEQLTFHSLELCYGARWNRSGVACYSR